MAKRRRPCGSKKQWQTVTTTQSVRILPPPQEQLLVQTAASQHPSLTARPTLHERFQALPPELRAHIFSILLVRPVKWDLPHESPCPLLTSDYNPELVADYDNYTCARCCSWYPGSWRLNTKSAWMNPYRSQYAPPTQNAYVCSDCWDDNFRPRPFPNTTSRLPCLCPRRRDLDILMVCRQWYEEAGHIFWAWNTFAFDDCVLFVDFVNSIPPRHRERITRASIMSTGWESPKQLAKFWPRLRTMLPSLRYLELDAKFLSELQTVQPMLRMGLRNIRQICFTLRHPDNLSTTLKGKFYPYPEFRQPHLLVGGLAEEVARAIKGERRRWMKDIGLLAAAIRWEYRRQRKPESWAKTEEWSILGWTNARRVDDMDNSDESSNTEDDDDVGMDPPLETDSLRRGHWRSWRPCYVGTLQNAAREEEAWRDGEDNNVMCDDDNRSDDEEGKDADWYNADDLPFAYCGCD